METLNIMVEHTGIGWIVQSDKDLESLVFLSGGRAEAYAKQVATAMARSWAANTCVTVMDARGQLVGRHLFAGQTIFDAVEVAPFVPAAIHSLGELSPIGHIAQHWRFASGKQAGNCVSESSASSS